MLPALEAIAEQYPDGDLTVLANDLRICIATLGAVWSAEMKESAASVGESDGGRLTGKAKLIAETGLAEKGRRARGEVTVGVPGESSESVAVGGSPGPPTTCDAVTSRQTPTDRNGGSGYPPEQLSSNSQKHHPPETELTEIGMHSAFHQALKDTKDPLVPVRGHGLLALARLIKQKDPNTLANAESLLVVFRENLGHPDSYIYLAAIEGVVALACVDLRKTLPVLCQEYAQLSDSHPGFDKVTGQLRERDGQPQARSPSCSFQVRVKLGEALVRVVRDCGEVLPHYSATILAAILVNVRDPDPLIRASSLSTLADLCPLMQFSFAQIQNEVCRWLPLLARGDQTFNCHFWTAQYL